MPLTPEQILTARAKYGIQTTSSSSVPSNTPADPSKLTGHALLNYVKTKPTPPPSTPKTGLIQRAAQGLGDITLGAAGNLAGSAMAGVGALGEYAGKNLGSALGLNDSGGESLSQAYQNQSQQMQGSGANDVQQTLTGKGIQPAQDAEQLGGQVLGTAADVGAFALAPETLAGATGAGALIGGGGAAADTMQQDAGLGNVVEHGVLGAAAGAAGGAIVGGLTEGLSRVLPGALEKKIMNSYTRAIKPSIVGKGSIGLNQKAKAGVVNALTTIVKNKGGLKYFDAEGQQVAGRLPQSVGEFESALGSLKTKVFQEYSNLTKQAGAGGTTIDTSAINKELQTLVDNPNLKLTNPGVASQAKALQEALTERGAMGLQDAEEVIQGFNNNQRASYGKANPDSSQIMIDQMVTGNLRKLLDEKVSSLTGESYQGLKNAYGSLASISKDVTKASQRVGRLNTKGLIDYTDIFTAGDIIRGLATGNPADVAGGLFMRGIKEYYKHMNSPNALIKRMFQNAEKAVSKGGFGSAAKEVESAVTKSVSKPMQDIKPPGFNSGTVPQTAGSSMAKNAAAGLIGIGGGAGSASALSFPGFDSTQQASETVNATPEQLGKSKSSIDQMMKTGQPKGESKDPNVMHYSFSQKPEVNKLLQQYFPDEKIAHIMYAISQAESSGNQTATSTMNRNRTKDSGLFQINDIHKKKGESTYEFRKRMKNVKENFQAASEVLKKEGFNAWTTYKSGAYKKYL